MAISLLDFLFPPSCVCCGAYHTHLCARCLGALPQAPPPPEPWVYAALQYQDSNVKKILWHLKYRGKRHLAAVCAHILYNAHLETLAEWRLLRAFIDPVIIGIPINRKKKLVRGFNQSERIARAFAPLIGASYIPDALIKVRRTRTQMSLKNRAERIANMEGAFAINPRITLADRNIIIIDDITTTGATLSEARRACLRAGASRVLALAVAH